MSSQVVQQDHKIQQKKQTIFMHFLLKQRKRIPIKRLVENKNIKVKKL
jgi:hypothetical protein